MNSNWIKSRWMKWMGFTLVLLAVAALAAGTTYYVTRLQRPAHQPHTFRLMPRPDRVNLQSSLTQLRQLQAEMDRLFANENAALNAVESVHPQHPEQMLAQMESLFRQMGITDHPFDPADTFDEGWNVLAISPAINMRSEKDRLILTATLPQTEKKDITLTLQGDVLKISAERHTQSVASDANTRSAHHSQSRFEQQIRLPAAPTAPETIEATFEDSVLTVIIPLPGLTPPHETQVPVR